MNTKKDKILIPGKVLGVGELGRKVKIVGFNASGMALEKIKINNIDKEAINSLLISSHGLEGDSLLAKKYLLAYLACKINYIVTKCTAENEGIITEKILSELLVYYDSLRRALQGVLQEKNA